MLSEDEYYHERPSHELPTPGLEPQPITYEEYSNLTPEKLELWEGFLVTRISHKIWKDEALKGLKYSHNKCFSVLAS